MTSQTIDLTPSWTGVLRLLLETHANGTDKGRRLALEELTRMAVLADEYVKQSKAPTSPMHDSARVETALDYMTRYNEQLDRLEIPPNGDDYNALNNGVLDILRDGVVAEINLKETGR